MEDKSESILQEEKDHALTAEAAETEAEVDSKKEDSSPDKMMMTKENPYLIPFSLAESTSTPPKRSLLKTSPSVERSWTSRYP